MRPSLSPVHSGDSHGNAAGEDPIANFHAWTKDFHLSTRAVCDQPGRFPAYRYGDQTFGLIVDWTVRRIALIEAEALGITKAERRPGHETR